MHIVIINCAHTKIYINIPTNKVAPLSVQESCDFHPKSFVQSLTFLNDLKNDGFEGDGMLEKLLQNDYKTKWL